MTTTTYPTHPSNRTVLRQVLRLGAEVTKSKGDHVTVKLPNNIKMNLRPPTYHQGNTSEVLQALYRAFGGPDKFWKGYTEQDRDKEPEMAKKKLPQPVMSDTSRVAAVRGFVASQKGSFTVDAVRHALGEPPNHNGVPAVLARLAKDGVVERVRQGVYVPVAPVKVSKQEPAAAPPPPPAPEPKPKLTEAKAEPEPPKAKRRTVRNTGVSNRVFDLMVDGQARSARAVAGALALEHVAAQGALVYLCRLGLLERVKSGVYKAKQDSRAPDTKLGIDIDVHDSRNNGVESPRSPAEPTAADHPVGDPDGTGNPDPDPEKVKPNGSVRADGGPARGGPPASSPSDSTFVPLVDDDNLWALLEICLDGPILMNREAMTAVNEWMEVTRRLMCLKASQS